MGQFSRFKGPLTKPSGKAPAIPKSVRPAQQALVARGQSKSIKRRASRYEELKASIRTWLEDRFVIAAALKEIRDDKLYKKEYSSFEDFCHDEYGMSRAHAYRLIEADKVMSSPEMSHLETSISNVSAALALKKVPESERAGVVEKVVGRGRLTAKAISAEAAGAGRCD